MSRLRNESLIHSYNLVLDYHCSNGSCHIPTSAKKVYKAATMLRYGKEVLTQEQIATLNKIGFSWSLTDERWITKYNQLVVYVKQEGISRVERPINPSLYLWCRDQRVKRKSGMLTDEQIQKLDKIGFIWNLDDERYYGRKSSAGVPKRSWEERYNELAILLAKGLPLGKTMRNWCDLQRRRRKTLTPQQIEKLERIGFVLDPHAAMWEQKYKEFVAYYNENASLPDSEDNIVLYRWLILQRRLYRSGKLSQERHAKLKKVIGTWYFD